MAYHLERRVYSLSEKKLPDGFWELYASALYTVYTGNTEPLIIALLVITIPFFVNKFK